MAERYPTQDSLAQPELLTQPEELLAVRQEIIADVEAFAAPGAPAERLFSLFVPAVTEIAEPGERLEVYEQVCREHFDFRRGPSGEVRERQEVSDILQQPRGVVGGELWDTTFGVGRESGMVNSTELGDGENIGRAGVLGALTRAMNVRTDYLLEQLQRHGATTKGFDYLVSDRKLSDGERQQLENIDPWAQTEADAAVAVAQQKLGTTVQDEQQVHGGRVISFNPIEINGKQITPRVLIADATEGRDRATTLDTYRLWQQQSGVQAGDSLVAVTTALYVPFQRANGDEIFGWDTGVRLKVIGHSAERAGTTRYANQILQEVKASVDSMHRIYQKKGELALVS